MTDLRITIIGAGVLGMSAARCAAELGAQVRILERTAVGAGSSSRGAGIVNRLALDPLQVALRVRNMDLLEQLERSEGLRLRREGLARLAFSEQEIESMRTAAHRLGELGSKEVTVLDPFELSRTVPALKTSDLFGALWGPRDGHLVNTELCRALLNACRRCGVEIGSRPSRVSAASEQGGVWILRTESGEAIECDVVINAAGAWAGLVGDLFGTSVPLWPQRHQTCRVTIDTPVDFVMPAVLEYVQGSGRYGLYVRQDGPRKLLAGLHSQEIQHQLGHADPDDYDEEVDSGYVDAVAAAVAARFPGLKVVRVDPGWAGLYPLSRDGLPIVGPARETASVVQLAGAGGSGVTSGLALGELAAEWAVLGTPASLAGAEQFAPDRFATATAARHAASSRR